MGPSVRVRWLCVVALAAACGEPSGTTEPSAAPVVASSPTVRRDDRGSDLELLGGTPPPRPQAPAYDDLVTALEPVSAERAQYVGPDDLVIEMALGTFGLNAYPALVELRAPLAGYRVWLQTTDDLDRPQYVLWLVSPDGERIRLGRQRARPGPCDGDGYYCEEVEDEECDDAALRRENRLCVRPRGIGTVHYAGGRLSVEGDDYDAGHGESAEYRWVVRLPRPYWP